MGKGEAEEEGVRDATRLNPVYITVTVTVTVNATVTVTGMWLRQRIKRECVVVVTVVASRCSCVYLDTYTYISGIVYLYP